LPFCFFFLKTTEIIIIFLDFQSADLEKIS